MLNDYEMEERIKDGNSHGGLSMSKHLDGSSKHLDMAELEMLLEAYFVQLDGTLNELSAVRISNFTLERAHACAKS